MFNYTRFIGHALVVALLYSKIMAETYQLPTLEYWISLALFTNVSNAAKLRCDASSGKIEAVLLDPSLIASKFHVLAATNKAVLNRESGQMKTRTVYSEVIFSLSPSMNISDSFKRFGVKDSSSNVLVVWITPSPDYQPQFEHLKGQVRGQLTDLTDLSKFHDVKEIEKVYKIPLEEMTISTLENSVVTRLTVKDIA